MASQEMCGDICADDATCTHWTWNGYNGGTCWLKKYTPSTKTESFGTSCGYVVSRNATSTSNELSSSNMSKMLSWIYSYRAQKGINTLTIDLRLVKAAQLHSQDQVNSCFMTHTGTDIAKVGGRIKAQGYTYDAVAENVAAGQTTVEDVMTSWWNSPGHRANILNKDVLDVGFALAMNGTCNNYKTYWTRDFGRVASCGLTCVTKHDYDRQY